ncbi:hypothetical protein [Peredibacter starrii]|uniref:Secreted protein n=1 Tax=Peredibacter starrii TaxID=28202 RepID=A0AAX4HR68_9BACT|nr:hypothetical protein [Peredibacter starrii]WPU65598.1 hypothetical protein SOO65_02440 [Peredibacter starrii]
MKHLLAFALVFTFLTSLSFANEEQSELGETATDCPMMAERNERSNPKANTGSQEVKVQTKSSATAQ